MSAKSYLDEPIIPGRSAGGILVGTPERDLPDFLVQRVYQLHTRYESDDLIVVMKDRVADTIYVQNGYRGRFADFLGIGTPILNVIRRYGPVALNDEDTLVLPTLPGLWLETEPASIDMPGFVYAKILHIGVDSVEADRAERSDRCTGKVPISFWEIYHHRLPEEAEVR